MKQLVAKNVIVFNWSDVIKAFAEHTGMSFNVLGCWNLDYTKICGEPDFSGHAILQHEQDYLYSYNCSLKQYCEGDLQKILAKSNKNNYGGKVYYQIPFHLIIECLIFHEILPEDNFFITNLSV